MQTYYSREVRAFLEEVSSLELNAISETHVQRGRRIGAGSFSVVSEAVLLTDNKDGNNMVVALKELRSDRHSFKVQQQQLLSEAAVLARLRHKSIIRYIGSGVSTHTKKPSLYMIQEYLSGGSLDEYISRLRRRRIVYDPRLSYSLRTGLRWAMQVADAVAYLHLTGIVHRDIKLANLLLTERNVERASVKLADFGLAADTTAIKPVPKANIKIASWKYLSLSKQTRKKISPWIESNTRSQRCMLPPVKLCTKWIKRTVTSVDSISQTESDQESYYDLTEETGSYMYMSPEVWLGLPYNEKADIYSLGVLIAEILTGRPLSCCLLPEKSYEEAKNFCYCVANGLQLKCPRHFPRPLAAVLDACWDPDPNKRPTAQAIFKVLEQYAASLSSPHKLPLFHALSLNSMQKIKLSVARIKSACLASNPVE